ncbi:MAG TPA: ABC transporter ATP-binding protein [Archaeoglobaceae archaeon]|nr:ABC transporter ATP-binding protein [Archaeoglobaceae archaeon]
MIAGVFEILFNFRQVQNEFIFYSQFRNVIAARCRDVWMVYKSLFSGERVALKSINLEIEDNQIFGLLGPNGAGKTTLISLMATLLTPVKGEIEILGYDALREIKKIRERINITSGNPNLIWSLTTWENLRYYSLSYGINDRKAIDELIGFFELEDQRDIEFNRLSTGNKQKVTLARAFVNNPSLVFLDEPTKGLDPDIAKRLMKKILDFQREKGITIVLTTHYMAEAEMMCDRIAFINNGRIVAEGDQKQLKNMLRMKDRIMIHFEGEVSEIKLEGVYTMDRSGKRYTFYVDDAEKRLADIIKFLSSSGRIKNIVVKEADLEDVFTELSQ